MQYSLSDHLISIVVTLVCLVAAILIHYEILRILTKFLKRKGMHSRVRILLLIFGLLGAHMIGAEVTELIKGYVVGRQLETTEEDLMNTVFPHPTLSEMMHESVLDAYGRVIHM